MTQNVWMVVDVNGMRVHGVQDNGEGYNKVLRQLSAKDEMQIEGVKSNLLF